MRTNSQFTVAVISYAPRVAEDLSLPILMLLLDKSESTAKIRKLRYLKDWHVFSARCPDADVEFVIAIVEQIEALCHQGRTEDVLAFLSSCSNTLRFKDEDVIMGDPETEFQSLCEQNFSVWS